MEKKQKFSKEEQKEILENANFPHRLTAKQTFNVLWWTIFNKKKFNHFIQRLKDGMSIIFAYEEAMLGKN